LTSENFGETPGVCVVCYGVIQVKREERQAASRGYYEHLIERQELRGRGFPTEYIGTLGENPLLKHSFVMGKKYEKTYDYSEAIQEYEQCLAHPKATSEEKAEAHILIGNCYYWLSRYKEARVQYENAHKEAGKVQDTWERPKAMAVALGNIAVAYQQLGKPDEALKYYEEALEILQRIGNRPQAQRTLRVILSLEKETSPDRQK